MKRKAAVPGFRILYLAGYLTITIVLVLEYVDIGPGPRFYKIALLLLAFAGFLTLMMKMGERFKNSRVFACLLVIPSAIAVAVMKTGYNASFGIVLLFIVCTSAGMFLPGFFGYLWVGIATALLYYTLLPTGVLGTSTPLLYAGLGLFAFAAFAMLYRHSIESREESRILLEELTEAESRLRDLAVMEERQRLAREMHDAVGHRLTAAAVLLEGGSRLIKTDPDRAQRMVDTSRMQVKQGLDELRAAVSAIRADPAVKLSVAEVLRSLADVYAQSAEASVKLSVDADIPEPDYDRKTVIVRTAQEALTNVRKHASATEIELSYVCENGSLILTCRDNGRGPLAGTDTTDGHETGCGLSNLRSRAAVFGGSVTLKPVPGGGSILRLQLPAAGEWNDG